MFGRRVFLAIFLVSLLAAVALYLFGLGPVLLQLVFSETPVITNIFGIIVALLVIFDIVLSILAYTPNEPLGPTFSLEKVFGPGFGGMFNTALTGYLSCSSVVTATSILGLDYRGQLVVLLPAVSIDLIISLMLVLLAFGGYTAFALFRYLWAYPFGKKKSHITPVERSTTGLPPSSGSTPTPTGRTTQRPRQLLRV